MTEDARNSLIAVTCVTALLAGFALFLWLAKAVEFPSWTPFAAFGLVLLNILIALLRWKKARSQRRKDRVGRT